MVGFSDLSNELVLIIWNFVEVDDVYNFSTFSKKVYLQTHELLREHCRLKHELSTIVDESGEPGTFGRVLKEVLLNPRAARYPSLLDIGTWAYEWEEDGEYSKNEVPESDLRLFKQAARDSVDVPEKELEEDWLAQIDKGDEGPLIALLLLLLPNLRKVKMGGDFPDYYFCITEALRVIADDEDSCSLRKLRSVDLECTTTDDESLGFNYVRLFAALPSVASIHSYIVGSDPDDLLETSPYLSVTNVTNLSFVKCLIYPKTISEFLYSTQNLERFFYSPKFFAANPADFDPFWIRTALLANAGNTLKILTILADGHARHFMGSLDGFRRLESVQTDFRLLIGDPSTSWHKPSTILPSSIVNITLHIKSSDHSAFYQDSIQDIVDSPTDFPKLENITVVGVADARAAELSHEGLILVLKARSTALSLVTDLETDEYDREGDAFSMSQALPTGL